MPRKVAMHVESGDEGLRSPHALHSRPPNRHVEARDADRVGMGDEMSVEMEVLVTEGRKGKSDAGWWSVGRTRKRRWEQGALEERKDHRGGFESGFLDSSRREIDDEEEAWGTIHELWNKEG